MNPYLWKHPSHPQCGVSESKGKIQSTVFKEHIKNNKPKCEKDVIISLHKHKPFPRLLAKHKIMSYPHDQLSLKAGITVIIIKTEKKVNDCG